MLGITGSIVLFTSCNPECNTPFSIESASSIISAGSEVLLRTNDDKFLDQLNGRKVFVNNRPLDDSATIFYPDFGLVVGPLALHRLHLREARDGFGIEPSWVVQATIHP